MRGREHRERAGEHDRVRAAGAAGEHRHRADGLQDKIHETAHLVGARGVLGELGEVRRRRLRRQRADLALGHIADGEVDLGEVAVLTEFADERVLVHARDELAEARERAAADAAADDVADLAALFRPKQRGAGAHAHHDRPLLPAQRQTAHADGGELLDLDRAHAVNVAVHIRGAHAGERDVADVRELQAVRGEEVAERAVERGERVLRLHAQHINDCAVFVQPHDLRAAAADVNAQNNAHFALLR